MGKNGIEGQGGAVLKIDVIIPVYKPDEKLFDLLDALEAQSRPVDAIILMNTERKYYEQLVRGRCMEERYPNLRVFHLTKQEFDHGGTRHRGVENSDGEIFIMMTQDAVPADERLVEHLTDALRGDVAVAYARQLPGDNSSVLERISRSFNYPGHSRVKTMADLEELGIKTFFCSNVCAAYRRDIYEESGGFVRHTIFNEDMIYAAGVVRAGYGVAYEAEAKVVHSHNDSNMQQLKRNFDLGVSQADHPEVFKSLSSESEGKKFVCAALKALAKTRQLYRFPGFCIQCCFKYTGYLLGKHYRQLPAGWIERLTSNQAYWKQEGGGMEGKGE